LLLKKRLMLLSIARMRLSECRIVSPYRDAIIFSLFYMTVTPADDMTLKRSK